MRFSTAFLGVLAAGVVFADHYFDDADDSISTLVEERSILNGQWYDAMLPLHS